MTSPIGTLGTLDIYSIVFDNRDTPGVITKVIKPNGQASIMLMWDGKGPIESRFHITTYCTRGTDVTLTENLVKSLAGTVQTLTIPDVASETDQFTCSIKSNSYQTSPCLLGDSDGTDTKVVSSWEIYLVRTST